MTRDLAQFPKDDNGTVLWRIHSGGDDLSKGRETDFSVVFPTEKAALEFAVHSLRSGMKVSFQKFEEQPQGLVWDVTIHKHLVPTHAAITSFEELLASEPTPLGGSNDGWGFFNQ